MTPLEHDELLTTCQIFEKDTGTRPEETNQRSEIESKETEHGATAGKSFGEEQGSLGQRSPEELSDGCGSRHGERTPERDPQTTDPGRRSTGPSSECAEDTKADERRCGN